MRKSSSVRSVVPAVATDVEDAQRGDRENQQVEERGRARGGEGQGPSVDSEIIVCDHSHGFPGRMFAALSKCLLVLEGLVVVRAVAVAAVTHPWRCPAHLCISTTEVRTAKCWP